MRSFLRLSPLLLLVWVLVSGVSFTGCASKKVDENDPASLYEDAENEIQNDRYQFAIDKLRIIRNKFPYSSYSAKAQLRIADVYFLQETFAESAAAYETFLELHPKDEKAAYAAFRIGEAYQNDVPSNTNRDLTSAQKSIDAFQKFISKHSTDAKAEEAKKSIAALQEQLAKKELQIGFFYLKQDRIKSARNRFEHILATYPSAPSAQEAQKQLASMKEQP